MARLPYADAQSSTAAIRERLARNPVSVLRMMAHAEGVFESWREYTDELLRKLELDPVLRELAILQLAHMRRCEYQWVHHVALARAVGVSAEQVAAIEEDRPDDASLSETDCEVLAFTREMVLDGAAGEQAVAALNARLGPRAVVELLLVVGHWSAICAFIQTLGLQPDLPAMAGALVDTLALGDATTPARARAVD
ncbi:MAG TPA: carboxymuconolactone decarboxylase family protein [Solirubrobacteraceae bacterium]|jgi:AhpD family alkylhydroperoxidase|nr:carboxymuconolactone decarboxylase family protein [Solirubrobacteraceae bacterium]